MTLIVGIKCSDGIALGADGAATFGALGQRTIRQPTTKLEILKENSVIGVSGPVGLGQQYSGELLKLLESKEFDRGTGQSAMSKMQRAFRAHCEEAFKGANMAMQGLGQVALQSAIATTLVALPVAGVPRLFQFDQQCAPEEATESLPFVAIGSGQSIADPFLAFLRRIFWPNDLPTLVEGVFAIFWTLQHAIQTNPGGVADPKQIVVLEKSDKGLRARELSQDDTLEHEEAIQEAESALRQLRERLASKAEEPGVEAPPKPPAA
jgi:20S proteasome alpha/beta subunit